MDNLKFKGVSGTWVADTNIVYQDSGIQGHICQLSDFFDIDSTLANAALISAAPELLAALTKIYLSIRGGGHVVSFMGHDIEELETILSKALNVDIS